MSQTDLSVKKISILLLGEIFAAVSIYFIKSSTMNPLLLSGGRLLTATIFLLPLAIKEYRDTGDKFRLSDILPSLIPGILLGFHFMTWITGARMIPSANATLIVNLTPAAMPFLLLFLTHERITLPEALGTVLVLGGSFILAYTDLKLEGDFFKGDLICFISMLAMAAYPVFSKKSMKGTFSYLVPLYFIAGIICLLTAFITGVPFNEAVTIHDWIAILGMGIISTLGGHSIINWAMKHMRGQVVSLFHTTQFFFAGIIGYTAFQEIPDKRFFFAALIIISGLIISIMSRGKSNRT
jgi:drug/metabolite transporter (DMT)-like permease